MTTNNVFTHSAQPAGFRYLSSFEAHTAPLTPPPRPHHQETASWRKEKIAHTAFLLLSKFRLIVDRFFKGCFNFQGFTRDWWLAFVRHVWSTHNNLIHDKDTMLVSTSIYQISLQVERKLSVVIYCR